MKPAAAEYDIVNAQLANLRQIDGGDDWHSNLGANANMDPLPGEDLPLHCWASEIRSDAEASVGLCSITWTAVVPLTGTDSTPALLVLADMRAALVSDCGLRADEVAMTYDARDPGSNLATVALTVAEFYSTGA